MRPAVFLIDDDEDILDFYQSVFSTEPDQFEVKAFKGVDLALAAIEQEGLPDAFLVDIMMPGTDGIEFTEMLKERGTHRPVIVISGYAQKEHAIRALNAGAFAMLEKPVSAVEIVVITQRAVAFHRALATVETLLDRQEELIANLERIKDSYERRLIDLENQVVEFKGKLTHPGMGPLQVLQMLKEDRILNGLISNAKTELMRIRENYAVGKIWR